MVRLSGVVTTPGLLATVTGINAKTVAATTLYTVPTGKSLIVDKVVVRITAFTAGGKTVQGTTSIGANSPSFNNWASANTWTITAVNKVLQITNTSYAQITDPVEAPVYAAGSVFTLNITTGSNATTETWAVDLFGYLV